MANDPTKTSAKSIIKGFLAQFGLQSLGDKAWQWWLHSQSMDFVMLNVRQSDEYKARFPAMSALAKQGRAVTEAQYVDLESSYSQLMRSYGLPAGLFDKPQDFANLIVNNVSPAELNTRLQTAAQFATQVPQSVRDEARRLYGIHDGDWTAFWLDPNLSLPAMMTKVNGATAAGASVEAGFGQLTAAQAQMAGQHAGNDYNTALAGFQQLAHLHELMLRLPGSGEQAISRDTGLSAVFGQNAQATEELQRRQAQRVGAFAGGGTFSGGQGGFSGLGEAQGA